MTTKLKTLGLIGGLLFLTTPVLAWEQVSEPVLRDGAPKVAPYWAQFRAEAGDTLSKPFAAFVKAAGLNYTWTTGGGSVINMNPDAPFAVNTDRGVIAGEVYWLPVHVADAAVPTVAAGGDLTPTELFMADTKRELKAIAEGLGAQVSDLKESNATWRQDETMAREAWAAAQVDQLPEMVRTSIESALDERAESSSPIMNWVEKKTGIAGNILVLVAVILLLGVIGFVGCWLVLRKAKRYTERYTDRKDNQNRLDTAEANEKIGKTLQLHGETLHKHSAGLDAISAQVNDPDTGLPRATVLAESAHEQAVKTNERMTDVIDAVAPATFDRDAVAPGILAKLDDGKAVLVTLYGDYVDNDGTPVGVIKIKKVWSDSCQDARYLIVGLSRRKDVFEQMQPVKLTNVAEKFEAGLLQRRFYAQSLVLAVAAE